MSAIDQLLHEHISEIEHGIRKYKNNPAPTIPIYDLTTVPPFLVDVDSWFCAVSLDGVVQDTLNFYWVRFVSPDDATSRAGQFDAGHQPFPSNFDVTRKNVLSLDGWKPATQNGMRYGTTIQDHNSINH